MAFGAPSQNKVKGQGGFKAPPTGYNKVSDTAPGGKPTGKIVKTPAEKYTGIHVPGIGGSGTTSAGPKPFKVGSGVGGLGKPVDPFSTVIPK